jgi:aryl-alcohol dehydrogenase-like predicted oxidoreductase
MTWLRALGETGIQVSAVGLGTVKLGRDQGVAYPNSFTIPDERSARALLTRARQLDINLIDTAPAYGDSERRLGKLLRGQRRDWVLCTKVGEQFSHGRSRFDFSPEATRASVRRSLSRLDTEVLDLVLVHSNGEDLHILEHLGTLEALREMKKEGLVRAIGMSTKTVPGGIAAAEVCDVVMLTYNLERREEAPVLDACHRLNRGALIKKALASGRLPGAEQDSLQAGMDLVFAHPGTTAAVIGTIDPDHLAADVAAARRAAG